MRKKLSALENANSLLVYQRKIIIRKEARTHVIIWMKFEDIVLSDISQSQRLIVCMIKVS